MSAFRRLVVVALAFLSAVFFVPAADAQPERAGRPATRLDCDYAVHLAFSPGITPVMEQIRITSTAPGVLSCRGTWEGHPVGGQGFMAFEGDAVGNCAWSTVDSVLRMDHPLAGGGRFSVALPFRAGRAGMAVHGTSGDPARPGSLTGLGTADAGQDCRSVPITGITAEGVATFGPWR